MTATNQNQHYQKLINMYLSGNTNRYYQPELIVDKESAEIKIKVKDEFWHAGRSVHGSVYFKALDDAAYFAVNSIVFDQFVVTASFNIYFTKPVSKGTITAKGKLVHKSLRLFLAESILYNEKGKIIARGSGSFMRSGKSLSEKIGYKL